MDYLVFNVCNLQINTKAKGAYILTNIRARQLVKLFKVNLAIMALNAFKHLATRFTKFFGGGGQAQICGELKHPCTTRICSSGWEYWNSPTLIAAHFQYSSFLSIEFVYFTRLACSVACKMVRFAWRTAKSGARAE